MLFIKSLQFKRLYIITLVLRNPFIDGSMNSIEHNLENTLKNLIYCNWVYREIVNFEACIYYVLWAL